MDKAKLWVNIVKIALFNLKWIMFLILVLNLFAFGYLEKMTAVGLCVEETVWGVVLIVAMFLLFAFDKSWKKICNKICEMLYQWLS